VNTTAPRANLKFQDLEDICLYRFYGLIWGKTPFVRVNYYDLKRVRPGDVSMHILTQIMESLRKKGMLIAKSVAGQPVFGISKKGIQYIDKQLEKPISTVTRYREEGDALLGVAEAPRPQDAASESAAEIDLALAKFQAVSGDGSPLEEIDLAIEADLGADPVDDGGPALEVEPGPDAAPPTPAVPAAPKERPSVTTPQPGRVYGWDEPDGAGTLPGPKVHEVQTLIREMIVTVDSGSYKERDRLQISCRIVAVRQLALMPMPPWNLVMTVLEPLESLGEFKHRIRKIRDYIERRA